MAFNIGNVSAEGNILHYGGKAIVIRKINSVKVTYSSEKFPKIAPFLIVVGMILVLSISFWSLIGLILVFSSGYSIHFWRENKYQYYLWMSIDSAESIQIPFHSDRDLAHNTKNAILKEINNIH